MAMSKIYKLFVGEYVHLIVRGMKGGGPNEVIKNLHIGGYLLDEDKTYYFIGSEGGEVEGAVKKEAVAAIIRANEVDELMDKIDVPDNQEVQ